MAIDIPAKLRRTAAALGCDSGEELCERFREVNPATECRPDRLRAWLRGRAVPRSTRLFADWAALAGLSHPGSWMAECGHRLPPKSRLEQFFSALAPGEARPLPPNA